MLLIGADQERYGIIKNHIQLNLAMGTNNYPDSLEEATKIINNHQKMNRYSNKHTKDGNQNTEMNFRQKGPNSEVIKI